MTHPESEDLTLLALGETTSTDIAGHLIGCAICVAEVGRLRTVVQIARSGELHEDEWDARPSPAVWDRIADDIGDARGGLRVVSGDERPTGGRHREPQPPLPGRPWRRYAAIGVAAVVGAVITLGATRPWEGPNAPAPPASVSVAQAELQPVDATDPATGSVQVLQRGDQEVVVVQARGLPLSKGYYEAWLFNPDDPEKMQSLGALADGDTTTFVLPAGFDLSTFSAVDISAETFDGDPAHSATSVLRGALTT